MRAKEIQLASLISDNESNLQNVIRNKLYYIEPYKQIAEEAEKDGDSNAASLFKALVADSERHVSSKDAPAPSEDKIDQWADTSVQPSS